jgi:phosphotransferase system HPr (HPr) family protein
VPARSDTTALARARLPEEVDLHARPAADFVRAAMRFEADLRLTYDGREANAKSLMTVLALGAKGGALIELSAEGDDATAAVEALADRLATLVE